MKIYLKLLLAAAIILLVAVSGVYGKDVSIDNGRTFSTSGSGSVQGAVSSGGTASFIIYPGDHTISPAVSNSAPGDVFQLLKGTYFDNVVIDRPLSITGVGPTLTTVDGSKPINEVGSVFTIKPDVIVSLSKMTIQGGSGTTILPWMDSVGGGIVNEGALTLDHVSIKDNNAVYAGGGICNIGTLNINSGTSITGNKANGVDDITGFGGGIYNVGTFNAATVNLNAGSSISYNSANYGGGGIYNDGAFNAATVNLNAGSSISDNSANCGAGIFTSPESAAVIMNMGSSVSNNKASNLGGGIYSDYGMITMNSGSSISDNSATYGGGGIYNIGGTVDMGKGSSISDNKAELSKGGGIYSYGGSIDMSGSISGNTAATWGGGIFTEYGFVIMNSGSSISGNTAGHGGGIFSNSQIFMNSGSSITDNRAVGYYDESGIPSPGEGGGIYNDLGIVTMYSGSSIADNRAEYGGGIYNRFGTVDMYAGSLVTRNIATAMTTNSGGGILNIVSSRSGGLTFYDISGNAIPGYDPNNNDKLYFFGPKKTKPDNKPDDVYYA